MLLRLYPRRIEYNDGDQGDWDLKINKIRFEIKTSTLGKDGKKFQNEGIKKDGDYDSVLFLGVTPNSLNIKFILKSDIPFNILHNREERKTGRGYKWDFKLKEMIEIKSLSDIQNEFDKHFSFLFKKP